MPTEVDCISRLFLISEVELTTAAGTQRYTLDGEWNWSKARAVQNDGLCATSVGVTPARATTC